MVGATASTVSNPRESESICFQPQQHLIEYKPPWNSTTFSFDSTFQGQQFAWPELEPSEFFSPASLLALPTDLSFNQDFLLVPDQHEEFGLSPSSSFVATTGIGATEFGGAAATSILEPVGDFWDHLSAGDNDMTLAHFNPPGRVGDSLIDVSSTIYMGSHDPHPAATDLGMPDTTAFHHNNSHHHHHAQTLSSASSTGNLSPEMYSLSSAYPDMTGSNLSDNSSDNFNPSDLFGEHHSHSQSHSQHQNQQQRAPSNPSPISSNSTPKSNKSTSKTHNSPIETPGPNPTSKIQKRTLNTLAARRYRQKRVDQVSSLETSLKETQDERDELKLKVARLEAEVEVLRGLVKK
ncbi:hypothetical protein IFR05_007984 [Cadophora sp. M221]|nr:hypothetical protein IFR05_007984 [Cadophora sp. M221]